MAYRFRKNVTESEVPEIYRWPERRRALRDDLRKEENADLEIERKWLAWTRYNPDHFEYFVEKYLHRIYGYLYRCLGDAEAAEVLTHETFCRAYEKLGQFKLRDVTIGAWLYRIATNLRNKYWQSRRRDIRRRVAIRDDLVASDEDVEGDYQRRQTASQLHAALLELREVYQKVLVLYYWEGLSSAEIAVVLDRKQSTIKGWLHRARRKLALLLDERGYHPREIADTFAAEIDAETAPQSAWGRRREARG